ncbi:hypothetical protein [Legionella spiritensis]|uniref:hypothetical protein n=1 Tax=Legionella spiritensis TaxID=452 RepID=UPI000F705C8E|nr:hypothetical protein [Legionella spiritensis]VEG89934.1 Uncharacterised protein [Legionella spiritensis]
MSYSNFFSKTSRFGAPFKKKSRALISLTVGTGGTFYGFDFRDQQRYQYAIELHRKDQEHLKNKSIEQFDSPQQLLQFIEQLPSGPVAHPYKEGYTPSRSQELVVQGFIGNLLFLFQQPNEHAKLVKACGDAMMHHFKCLTEKGLKYQSDLALANTALELPREILHERAKELGIPLEKYISVLKDRNQHAIDGIEATLALKADIEYRLAVHNRLVAKYPQAKDALEKLTKVDISELSKITELSESECRNIIEAGISSAMYGIGLITGQTVAGLEGQVIKDEHLDSIVEIAETLGKHAMRLVHFYEAIKDKSLTDQQRYDITKKIKADYHENIKMMRKKEASLTMDTALDGEFSIALAHLLAWSQGPKNLYSNVNLSRKAGGAVAIQPGDILALHHQGPHCINEDHSHGSQKLSKPRVPGLLERMRYTMIGGNQPWLIDSDSRKLDIDKAYHDTKERIGLAG